MGNVNMCKALQDMVQDVVDEKKDDWLAEGRNEGRLAGLTEGRLQLLTSFIQSGKVTVKEAASIMNMTLEEFLAKSKNIS